MHINFVKVLQCTGVGLEVTMKIYSTKNFDLYIYIIFIFGVIGINAQIIVLLKEIS